MTELHKLMTAVMFCLAIGRSILLTVLQSYSAGRYFDSLGHYTCFFFPLALHDLLDLDLKSLTAKDWIILTLNRSVW